jgi:hypothetical protein
LFPSIHINVLPQFSGIIFSTKYIFHTAIKIAYLAGTASSWTQAQQACGRYSSKHLNHSIWVDKIINLKHWHSNWALAIKNINEKADVNPVMKPFCYKSQRAIKRNKVQPWVCKSAITIHLASFLNLFIRKNFHSWTLSFFSTICVQ